MDEGYKQVIDMDLEKYFDTVNQSKLVEVLSRTIKDGRVISLIHKYLKAGVIISHSFEKGCVQRCSQFRIGNLETKLLTA